MEQNALEALDRFITTFNSRNAEQWSESLSYPHVRPTMVRAPRIFADAGEYAGSFDYNRALKMGWDHSVWDYKNIIHVSPDKVHASGQYTRYTADGEVIWANEVMYVVTRVRDRWGIQARFGIDQMTETKPAIEEVEPIVSELMEAFIAAINSRSREQVAALLNFTYVDVDAGRVDAWPDIEACLREQTRFPVRFAPEGGHVGLVSCDLVQRSIVTLNVAADMDCFNEKGDKVSRARAVYWITRKDGKWGIQAGSAMEG